MICWKHNTGCTRTETKFCLSEYRLLSVRCKANPSEGVHPRDMRERITRAARERKRDLVYLNIDLLSVRCNANPSEGVHSRDMRGRITRAARERRRDLVYLNLDLLSVRCKANPSAK